MKKHNIERHYKTNHNSFEVAFPPKSDQRNREIERLKSSIKAQQNFLSNFLSGNANTTLASFKIAYLLGRKKKAFMDSELIKQAFITGADALFEGFNNKKEIVSAIQNIQLSNDTTAKRIQDISTDLQSQLKTDIENCECYSLQFDESLDICNTAQLAVCIRMVFADFSIKEEFLKLLPMKNQTRGEDIFNVFKNFAEESCMPLKKVSAIITDGAPAMIGKYSGFLAFCRKYPSFSQFLSFHCIIHQEVLCSKTLPFEHVFNIVFKIVNLIRSNPLSHRIFKNIIENDNPEQNILVLHTNIRWLSRGKTLCRFFDLLEEIKSFLSTKKMIFEELNNVDWLMDLAFITDICEKINILNLELQGNNKDIAAMISSIKGFKAKLQFWKNNFEAESLTHFPRMKKIFNNDQTKFLKFISCLANLYKEFECRFEQFSIIDPIVTFFINPFNSNIDITKLANSMGQILQKESDKIEIEILNIQNDIMLQSIGLNEKFWNIVDAKKYPILKTGAYIIKSYFVSTYLCNPCFPQ
ncbi:MAG: hypothetical protein ACRC0V_12975 [Fusobacteriaceae bacterium]